jgi:hypothetical protein
LGQPPYAAAPATEISWLWWNFPPFPRSCQILSESAQNPPENNETSKNNYEALKNNFEALPDKCDAFQSDWELLQEQLGGFTE